MRSCADAPAGSISTSSTVRGRQLTDALHAGRRRTGRARGARARHALRDALPLAHGGARVAARGGGRVWTPGSGPCTVPTRGGPAGRCKGGGPSLKLRLLGLETAHHLLDVVLAVLARHLLDQRVRGVEAVRDRPVVQDHDVLGIAVVLLHRRPRDLALL